MTLKIAVGDFPSRTSAVIGIVANRLVWFHEGFLQWEWSVPCIFRRPCQWALVNRPDAERQVENQPRGHPMLILYPTCASPLAWGMWAVFDGHSGEDEGTVERDFESRAYPCSHMAGSCQSFPPVTVDFCSIRIILMRNPRCRAENIPYAHDRQIS